MTLAIIHYIVIIDLLSLFPFSLSLTHVILHPTVACANSFGNVELQFMCLFPSGKC